MLASLNAGIKVTEKVVKIRDGMAKLRFIKAFLLVTYAIPAQHAPRSPRVMPNDLYSPFLKEFLAYYGLGLYYPKTELGFAIKITPKMPHMQTIMS